MDFYCTNSISFFVNNSNSETEKLFFLQSPPFFRASYNDGNLTINLTLVTLGNFLIERINLLYVYLGDETRKELSLIQGSDVKKWVITLNIPNYYRNNFSFRFSISTKKGELFFDPNGLHKYSVDNLSNFKVYLNQDWHWIQESIVYHIFVDRFYGREFNVKSTSDDQFDFMMGDLYGIQDKIRYLIDLGINTLCLTPVFSSTTNHRYDVENHFEIDAKLGGNPAFYQFMNECKSNGIRVILDGVFNHISRNSKLFLDDFINGKEPCENYFCTTDNLHGYECFWGVALLPKLNYRSSELRNYIFSNDNSVVKSWLGPPFDVDGIRIDACTMVGRYADVDLQKEILSGIYFSAKSKKRDCYILGENPFDPTDLTPFEHYDGITNYSGFYTPLLKWVCTGELETFEFVMHLNRFKALLGLGFLLRSQNFIGNHDKKRFFSILNKNRKLYHVSLAILFFYPGVPTLYYGEEYGLMDSSVENDSRMCMKWFDFTDFELEINEFIRRLIYIRNSHKLLSCGDVIFNYYDKDTLIFTRAYNDQYICALVSKSSSPELNTRFDFSFIAKFYGSDFFTEKFVQLVDICIENEICIVHGHLEKGVLLFSNHPL